MSSASWIYNARRFNYPLPQKLQQLISQFNAKVTDDVNDEGGEELQIRSEGGIGRSYLKFCDTDLSRLDNSLTDTVITTLQSCPILEPDNDKCRLIVEFNNTGGVILDQSGFGHDAKVYGVPRMQWGIRYGYGELSLENIFDGRTNYGIIVDHPDLSFIGTSFSIQLRFSPYDLTMSSVHKQVIICKKDKSDTTGATWYSLELDSNGSLTFNLSIHGLIQSITTASNIITATDYNTTDETTPRFDVAVTYDNLTPTLILYVNGTAYTTVVTTLPASSNIPDYTGYDLMIGRWTALVGRPITLPQIEDIDPIRLFSKLFFGTFQQLKYWKGRVLTSTEISNHYTNKLTISAVDYAEVAIPNAGMILLT